MKISPKNKNKRRNSVVWILLVFQSIVVFFSMLFSQVSITKPSLNFGYCSLPSNYHTLGDIIIQETNASDFSVGTTVAFHIPAPLNFEFQPGTGSANAMSGGNISSVVITVSALNVIIQYNCNAISKIDKLTISGLAVRAVNGPNSIAMRRNGGNAIINGLANNTLVTNLIVSTQTAGGLFRTVSNISGVLNWYQSSTWECGVIPPNDGTADVYIRAYNGTFSAGNVVTFSGATNIKSIQIETGANFSPAMGSGYAFTVLGNFIIQNGGFLRQRNWIQNGLNTIKIGGDLINNGEMLTDGSNNAYDLSIEMNGSQPQIINGMGIYRMIGNGTTTSQLIITNPAGVTIKTNFSTNGTFGDPGQVLINGYLIFDSEFIQFTGSGSLLLNGKVTLRASSFNGNCAMAGLKVISNSSTVEFTHPNSSISPSNIPTLSLNNLEVTVGGAGFLNLSSNVTVNNTLFMNSGIINTNVNILELGNSLSVLGSLNYNSGFIKGNLKRWFSGINSGNSSGLFPLSDMSGTYQRFVTIEYLENTDGGSLQASWVENPMGNSYTTQPVLTGCGGNFLITKTASGYWSISPSNGILSTEQKKYKITLKATGINDFMNDCHITAVKKEANGVWTQSGVHIDNQGNATDPVIQRIEATGWSNWGFAGDEQPLPVELIDFSCKKVNDKIHITWTTASEFNSIYFELFRSKDGEEWQFIDKQDAAGVSNKKIDYLVVDTFRNYNPYYLLKQIDNDGKYVSYGPINLAEIHMDFLQFFVTPNPSSKDFKLYVINPFYFEQTNFIMRDIIGRIVYQESIKLQNGLNEFVIDIEGIDAGIYYLSILNQTKNSKIIKHIIIKD